MCVLMIFNHQQAFWILKRSSSLIGSSLEMNASILSQRQEILGENLILCIVYFRQSSALFSILFLQNIQSISTVSLQPITDEKLI